MEKKQKDITYHDESILEIYDIVTGERTAVKEFLYLIEAPNWSPDGKYLFFNSVGKIYRLDLSTKEVCLVDTDFAGNCNNDHVISADGSLMAVSHRAAEDNGCRIYTLPLSGGKPQLITPLAPSYLHGWSPDGKTMAYCACRNGEYDIYTIPSDGGVETRLTDAPGLDDGPEYDSTGEYIWFNSVRTGLMQAWRMKADGSQQTQMTFDTEWNTWFPHISPDGSKVVSISYRKGDLLPDQHLPHKNVELRLMNADGSDVSTIVSLFGGQGTINVNSWAPDSRRFAFVSYRLMPDKNMEE